MPIATAEAPARAALLGNPSDGYRGRTIGFALANFRATATAREKATAGERPPRGATAKRAAPSHEAAADARAVSYRASSRPPEPEGSYRASSRPPEPEGGALVDAARTRFARHCAAVGAPFAGRAIEIDFATTIPRSVGLAGSSAIVTAVLRALSALRAVPLSAETLAKLALEAETEELGIAAGPQDRVLQANGGLLDMDFARGTVERLDRDLLPPLYLAYHADAAQPSGAVHGDLRARFHRGDRAVVDAMAELARIASEGRQALERRDTARLAALVDRNFDVRRSILDLDARHVEMVELARSLGASAHFPGSGGAVLGTHHGADHIRVLREAFTAEGCVVVEPSVAPESRGSWLGESSHSAEAP